MIYIYIYIYMYIHIYIYIYILYYIIYVPGPRILAPRPPHPMVWSLILRLPPSSFGLLWGWRGSQTGCVR